MSKGEPGLRRLRGEDGSGAACTLMQGLPPEALARIASFFQVLSEPTRLRILNVLRLGEHNVGEMAQACGYTPANISRHLSLLTQHGLVLRESRRSAVYYSIADDSVYALCDHVCASIARQVERTTAGRDAFRRAGPAD